MFSKAWKVNFSVSTRVVSTPRLFTRYGFHSRSFSSGLEQPPRRQGVQDLHTPAPSSQTPHPPLHSTLSSSQAQSSRLSSDTVLSARTLSPPPTQPPRRSTAVKSILLLLICGGAVIFLYLYDLSKLSFWVADAIQEKRYDDAARLTVKLNRPQGKVLQWDTEEAIVQMFRDPEHAGKYAIEILNRTMGMNDLRAATWTQMAILTAAIDLKSPFVFDSDPWEKIWIENARRLNTDSSKPEAVALHAHATAQLQRKDFSGVATTARELMTVTREHGSQWWNAQRLLVEGLVYNGDNEGATAELTKILSMNQLEKSGAAVRTVFAHYMPCLGYPLHEAGKLWLSLKRLVVLNSNGHSKYFDCGVTDVVMKGLDEDKEWKQDLRVKFQQHAFNPVEHSGAVLRLSVHNSTLSSPPIAEVSYAITEDSLLHPVTIEIAIPNNVKRSTLVGTAVLYKDEESKDILDGFFFAPPTD